MAITKGARNWGNIPKNSSLDAHSNNQTNSTLWRAGVVARSRKTQIKLFSKIRITGNYRSSEDYDLVP